MSSTPPPYTASNPLSALAYKYMGFEKATPMSAGRMKRG